MGKKSTKPRPQPQPVPAVAADLPSGGVEPRAALGTSQMARRAAFANWAPQLWDADTGQQWERDDKRAASRALYDESPPARAAIQKGVEYRVGTGLRLQSTIDADELRLTDEQAEEWQDRTEKRFNMWASSAFASVEGDQCFYELQQLIAKSRALSGDVFAVITQKDRPNWPFKTAIQLIEADRVCNEKATANTNEIYEGIRRKTDGEIVSIFVADHHPNRHVSAQITRTWREIPIFAPNGRRNIIHAKKMERPGQTRGMPALSVVASILKSVTRYSEAELEAAVNSAALAIFATMSPDSFKELFQNPAEQEEYITHAMKARADATSLDSGKLLNLFPGESVVSPTPGRPNPNFGQFVEDFYIQLGMGLNEPMEVITGLFKSSYTAARAALQQLWQSIYIDRASDEVQICNPIYQAWLFDSVGDGIIQAPGFFRDPFIRHAWSIANWTGMGPSSLNPLQEAQAAVLLAQNITSEQEEAVKFDGGDWRTRHRLRVRAAEARRRDGLPPLGAKVADAPAQDQQQDQGQDQQQDNSDANP